MRLPNVELALVERAKVVEYLLNPAHPDGTGKAAFFCSRTFHPERWEILAEALVELALRHEVASSTASPHGEKFVVDGNLSCPDGTTARVRTIWIVDAGQIRPRLVSAYPR